MPKVIITPNPAYNPTGVRLLLSDIGVGPMLQDSEKITCQMSDAQIDRFRNGRGAAHKLEVVPDAPAPPPETCPESDDEPHATDPTTHEPPKFPQTWGRRGSKRVIVNNEDAARIAAEDGYLRVKPDPLDQSTTPILDGGDDVA